MSPDFGVEDVQYDNDGSTISKLLIRRREADGSMRLLGWYAKQGIINSIESGRSYITIGIDRQVNTWCGGQEIHVVTTLRGKYLRTDRNGVAADNLGRLPMACR